MCAASDDEDMLVIPLPDLIRSVVTDPHMEFGWVFAHSHPGRPPLPSEQDDTATMILSWIAYTAGRPLVDHWIFGQKGEAWELFSYGWSKPGHLRPSVKVIPNDNPGDPQHSGVS